MAIVLHEVLAWWLALAGASGLNAWHFLALPLVGFVLGWVMAGDAGGNRRTVPTTLRFVAFIATAQAGFALPELLTGDYEHLPRRIVGTVILMGVTAGAAAAMSLRWRLRR